MSPPWSPRPSTTGSTWSPRWSSCAPQSLAERALVPAFVFFFQLLYPFARVNDPRSAHRGRGRRHDAGAAHRARADRRHRQPARRADRRRDPRRAASSRGGPIYLGHSRLARSAAALSRRRRYLAHGRAHRLRAAPLLAAAAARHRARPGPGLAGAAAAIALFGHGPARWLARARLGRLGALLPADAAPLPPVAALGAGAAGDRQLLHGRHDRLRARPPSRPRRASGNAAPTEEAGA